MRTGKFLLAIISLVIGLLLAEGLLGLFAPQVYRRPRLWEFDKRLGWRHISGAQGEMVTPEFECEVAINADGLRDRDYPRERRAGSRRLLAFGDSFIEGWGVPLEASVSKRLERELGEEENSAEVINFGVAGYGTDQELLFYEELGRLYRPDQVLLFFYGNDLWNNAAKQGIGAERGFKPYFRVGRNGRLELHGVPVRKIPQWEAEWTENLPWDRRLERYLSRHWHLYVLIGKAFADEEVDQGQRQQFYEGLYGKDLEGHWQPLWELSGRLLQAFAERVEQNGGRLLLVYVPAIVQVEEEDWRAKKELNGLMGKFDLKKPNRQLATFAVRYGIRFLDLLPAFEEAAVDERLYLRDSHWNERGHALAAERIAAFLEEEWEREGGDGGE